MDRYSLALPELEQELNTNFHSGLSPEEAQKRLAQYGPNELPEGASDSWFTIFLRQFKSPLIYLLLGAGVFMIATGEGLDAIIVGVVLLFNATVGTIQEGRAQNTLGALKKFTQTQALVLRGGRELIISDREVVLGDVLIVQEGERVSADARVLESQVLEADESTITGESLPVYKQEKTLSTPRNIAEQTNMVFKGTYITRGNGKVVATATGSNTFIGSISEKIATVKTEIPLQKSVAFLSKIVIICVFGIGVGLFALGIMLGNPVQTMIETVITLAVSIIPEGLPIVMTLVLAGGVWRMARRNALVKQLQAVEALGQAQVIAVDKTGTLTRNEMVVRKVYVGSTVFDIGGVGYEATGEVQKGTATIQPANHPELLLAGKIAALTATAQLSFLPEEQKWRVAGDPTEAALLVLSQKFGFAKEDLLEEMPMVAEIPFDYKMKYHATAHRFGTVQFVALAGAPEAVLALCTRELQDGKPQTLTAKRREEIESIIHQFSRQGLRVIAFAHAQHPIKKKGGNGIELEKMVFSGLCGMQDALRAEVPEALARAKEAGIRVVMITGDHKLTAEAIAREAGIYHDGDVVIGDDDLAALSDKELSERLAHVSVFARITPEHKQRIIQAYRQRGIIVAMTGDGVNDAPSLVAADLGVAMGKGGTEVAKAAADIVLMDDNFGTIVAAVEEGRAIARTIKKVILYLFSTGAGEVMTIAGALFLGFPLPVFPVQILWLNLITDGFLDVSLGMEPKDDNILRQKLTAGGRRIVDWLMGARMLVMAIPMTVGTLYLFYGVFHYDLARAVTIAMTSLAVFQWFNAWNCRSEDQSVFSKSLFSNPYLFAATVTVIMLQLFALYTPFMNRILHTVPIGFTDWIRIVVVALWIIVAEEIRKFFHRLVLGRRIKNAV